MGDKMITDKRRIINISRIIRIAIALLIIVLILLSIPKLFRNRNTNNIIYSAGISNRIKLYDGKLNEVTDIARGTKLEKFGKEVIATESKEVYIKVRYNNKEYLIKKNDTTNREEEVVKETEMYVRTPLTIYINDTDSSILGMAKKGEKLEILGYDKLNQDGSVNKYKIKQGDNEGYVYGKYLVNTEEEALKNYDQDGNYQIHLGRVDHLGGGSGGNLDYYPRQKPHFENNIMPNEVRALYLNVAAVSNVDQYIAFAKENNINTLVVDIKDNTRPGYSSAVMKEMSPTNYNHAANSYEGYKNAIKKIKDAGLYAIGRITVFKDSYYVQDHPEAAIGDTTTGNPYSHNNSYWPSAYDRGVWKFNVELAKEAVKEMGFNEIQFDYVRFPDNLGKLEKEGVIDLKNKYNEEKAQAIQGFLMYATDEIHQLGAYVSADVFGESAHKYVTAYGQYWPAISNIVDVISAMPYPDHFSAYEYGFTNVVWTVPYDLLKFWGTNYAAVRQTEIPTPAIARTWIQVYNTIRSPYIEYDANKVSDQIKALYDSGLTGGYMTWNSGSSLDKYNEVKDAFKKEY